MLLVSHYTDNSLNFSTRSICWRW